MTCCSTVPDTCGKLAGSKRAVLPAECIAVSNSIDLNGLASSLIWHGHIKSSGQVNARGLRRILLRAFDTEMEAIVILLRPRLWLPPYVNSNDNGDVDAISLRAVPHATSVESSSSGSTTALPKKHQRRRCKHQRQRQKEKVEKRACDSLLRLTE